MRCHVQDFSADANHVWRAPPRQFSSCVLIECGDSLDSINATSPREIRLPACRYRHQRRSSALGSPIRGGEAFHTGCIPFYKHFQTAGKILLSGRRARRCCDPVLPNVAPGSESLLVLKNNRGVATAPHGLRRADQQTDMYTRLLKGEEITLFSPSDVPGLYAFFADQDEFERLYTKYEKDDSIRKQRVKAGTCSP
jgi:ribonucleoside-diphosphate reductase alpha chain